MPLLYSNFDELSIFEEISVKGMAKQLNLGLPRFQFPIVEYRESLSVQKA